MGLLEVVQYNSLLLIPVDITLGPFPHVQQRYLYLAIKDNPVVIPDTRPTPRGSPLLHLSMCKMCQNLRCNAYNRSIVRFSRPYINTYSCRVTSFGYRIPLTYSQKGIHYLMSYNDYETSGGYGKRSKGSSH